MSNHAGSAAATPRTIERVDHASVASGSTPNNQPSAMATGMHANSSIRNNQRLRRLSNIAAVYRPLGLGGDVI
jgi:hypothetical protein